MEDLTLKTNCQGKYLQLSVWKRHEKWRRLYDEDLSIFICNNCLSMLG